MSGQRILLLTMGLLLVADGTGSGTEPRSGAQTLVLDNSAFALDLYGKLSSEPGNLFFSPYGISTAFAMVYAGARGHTEKEMADVLHFSLDQQSLHPAFDALQAGLNEAQQAGNVQLSIANSLWLQRGCRCQREYLLLLRARHRATVASVDFRGQRALTCRTINKWVSTRTAGRIPDLLQPEALSDSTLLMLVNALYFKGKWQRPFAPKATERAPFRVSPEESVQVSMMHREETFRYAGLESVEVLELPYRGAELSMLVVLPRETEGIRQLEKGLSVASLDTWRGLLQDRQVNVFLPRFRVTFGIELTKMLQAMGMRDVFIDKTADLSGMSNVRPLFLGGVYHKAFVEVDEQGTEAAAATAVGGLGGVSEPPVFRADHPFLFLIQENRTGSILFLGRVTDPATGE